MRDHDRTYVVRGTTRIVQMRSPSIDSGRGRCASLSVRESLRLGGGRLGADLASGAGRDRRSRWRDLAGCTCR
jgi:hypothetical protein